MKPNFGELSPNMIELLSKGKIAVENDDLELLRSIMKIAFPDAIEINGDGYRYKAWGNVGWTILDIGHLQIYKATDFIIPERFAVFVDKNNHADVKRILQINDSLNYENRYYHVPYHAGHNDWSHVQEGYKLLTFDHFKLLFDGGEEEKEIEYKLDDLVVESHYYYNEIFKVVGIRKDEVELEGDWSGGTHNVCQRSWIKKINIRPYVKFPEVIIKVGACKIPIQINKQGIFYKGEILNIEDIRSLIYRGGISATKGSQAISFPFELTSGTFKISDLDNVTVCEIKEVLTAYDKIANGKF